MLGFIAFLLRKKTAVFSKSSEWQIQQDNRQATFCSSQNLMVAMRMLKRRPRRGRCRRRLRRSRP